MIQNVVALIPARGGSSSIPQKNLVELGGKSLLTRAIEAAQLTPEIGRVIVSSDDSLTLSVAKSAGAECHHREAASATSESRAREVVIDFLEGEIASDVSANSIIAYLQPTSPFRSTRHLSEAITLFESLGADSLLSVVRPGYFPEKFISVDYDGKVLEIVDPGANRQDLKIALYPNGAIYLFTVDRFLTSGDIPVSGAFVYEMNRIDSLDIDDQLDLEIARIVEANGHL